MEILKCEGVRKVYGNGGNQTVALDGIDLSVEKGEFTAIIGASGSGKSTLLHILGNVDKPTEGKVMIDGTDLSTLNRTQAAIFRRRKVGLVYQFYNLIPSIDVRQNILLPMLLDGQKPDEKRFDELTEILGSDRFAWPIREVRRAARSVVRRPTAKGCYCARFAVPSGAAFGGRTDRKSGSEKFQRNH